MTEEEFSIYKDSVLFNFNAVSKIMEQYIIHFYNKHKGETKPPLLKFNQDNVNKFKKMLKNRQGKLQEK